MNKRTITRNLKAMPIIVASLFLMFVVDTQSKVCAQTTDMFISAYPTSRGRINVDALTNLREHEATYTVGTQIELTAVPFDGSEFVDWRDDENNVVSTNASFTYTVPNVGYRELTASFRQTVIRYNVSAVVTPANAGSVAGTGRVAENNDAQLLVTPSDAVHYHFDGWSWSSTPGSEFTDNPYLAFTVTQDTVAYAYYTYMPQRLTVTANASPNAGGTATVSYGSNVNQTSITDVLELDNFTLTATPNSNYTFTGWTRAGSSRILSTDLSWTHAMPAFSSDSTYTANFSSVTAQYNISFTTNRDGGNPTANYYANVLAGTTIILNPGTYSDHTFLGWYVDYNNDGLYTDDELVSTTPNYSFDIYFNMSFHAKYQHNPWNLAVTANPAVAGQFSITGANPGNTTVSDGATLSVTATVAAGQEMNYRFNRWTGDNTGTNPTINITSVTRDYSFTANYINTYTFDASANNGGSVTVTPGTGVVANGNGTYDIHATFSVTAGVASGKVFSHWIVDGVDHTELTDPTYNVTDLDHNMTLVANYVNTHTVTVTTNPGVVDDLVLSINGNPCTAGTAYTFREGQEVTVRVVSFNTTAFNYLKWTNTGSATQLNNDGDQFYTFNLGTENRNLVVHFEPRVVEYTVTTQVNDNSYGTITSNNLTLVGGIDEHVVANTTLDLRANATDGYHFDHWDVNGVNYTNNPLNSGATIRVNSNMNVTAYFLPNTSVTVSVTSNPVDPSIILTGAGTYNSGDDVIITAASTSSDLTFWVWTVDGVPTASTEPGDPTLTIHSIDANKSIVAYFFDNSRAHDAELLDFNADSSEVIRVKPQYRTLVTSITIPQLVSNPGVFTIRENAFANCTNLQHVNLGPQVNHIGKYAFANCPALEEIVVPNADAVIDSNAFNACSSLQRATLPANLTVIKGGLFSGCTSLANIEIPATVTTIEGQAFMGCRSLYSIKIPASVATVGKQAFMGMNGLRMVTINEGVTSFGEDCFDRTNYIAQTNYTGSLAQWCNISFANAAANPATKSHNLFLNGQMITKLEIPTGVTTINKFAFYYNTHIDTIVLPATVTTIDSMAFYRLTNLKRIILNSIPTNVHADAFNTVDKNNVVVEVPCSLYTPDMTWEGFTTVVATGMPVLKVVQRPGGVVTITHKPQCSDPEYYYTLNATKADGFILIGWSDGLTGYTRTITPHADMTISPIWGHIDDGNGADGKRYKFETENAGASWFCMNAGANEWKIGTATAQQGTHSLYVTNDGGAHNTYSLGSSPYTYTEINFNEAGLYEINFQAQVSNVDGHYLSAALIPVPEDIDNDNFDRLDPHDASVKLLFDNITGDGTWKLNSRVVNFDNNDFGWYRLVFFWNVNSDEEPATYSAAIDNIQINLMDEDQLRTRFTSVNVSSNNNDYGYAHTGTAITNVADANVDSMYFYGDVIQIHAYAKNGYRFLRWSDGSTEADRSFDFVELYNVSRNNMPIGSNYFTAIFEEDNAGYRVLVSLENGAAGATTEYGVKEVLSTVNIGGTDYEVTQLRDELLIPNNQDAVLMVNLTQKGWAFMGWADENGDTISIDNPFVYTGRNDIHLTALLAEYQECPDLEYFFINSSYYPRMPRIDNNDIVNNVEIRIVNGQVVIENSGDLDVTLYDVNGRALQTGNGNGNNVVFDVPVSGSYLVSVGNLLTRRVVVIR
jgi:uncharacterized repeat protein (TIGR02543 family)